MKKTLNSFLLLLAAASFLSFSGCSSSKKATKGNETSNKIIPAQSNAAYAGTWSYLVKGTPDGDTKGDMIITMNGNVPKGVLSVSGAQTEIQDLKIENNVLTGVFYYNGMTINMAGTFTGNLYEGKVEAQGYAFPMTATKN